MVIAPAGAPIGCTCDWHDVTPAHKPPRSEWQRGVASPDCPSHGSLSPASFTAVPTQLLADALAALEMCGARECYLGERWRHCRTSAVCDRLARLAERIEAVLDGSGSAQVP